MSVFTSLTLVQLRMMMVVMMMRVVMMRAVTRSTEEQRCQNVFQNVKCANALRAPPDAVRIIN